MINLKRSLVFTTIMILIIAQPLWSATKATDENLKYASGDTKELLLATTTSVYDTGLIDTLAPLFERSYGFHLKTLAVGTGRALRMGKEKEVDVLLVHAPPAEKKFVKEGFGLSRTFIMHNYFVIAGPQSDPANIKNAINAEDAMTRICKGNFTFCSRGDNSGTHQKELIIRKAARISDELIKKWTNYKEIGQGQSATLRIADEMSAYDLTDIGSFLYLSKTIELKALFNKGNALINKYSIITVSPDKSGKVSINTKGANAFRAFMLKRGTQWIIGRKGVKEFGQQLFIPKL